MKIYKYKEFKKLPIGTLFSYYKHCSFRDIFIKESSKDYGDIDFMYSSIVGAIEDESSEDFVDKCEKMENGESVSVDFDSVEREGLFDEEQLYAVYEKEDVEKLIDRLNKL